MKLQLPEHKVKFLLDNGFEKTYGDDGPIKSMGKWVHMENWIKPVPEYDYKFDLYIHFSEGEQNGFCNLYCGGDGFHPEVFSERNLISELKKRGIGA